MSFDRTERKLVAILVADVVGYTRLMETREHETHAELMRLRTEVLDPLTGSHYGRIIRNTGDGFLAMFDSALDATRCCLALQRAIAENAARTPAERQIAFRLGVNIADAIIEKDDIYGSGVNIAARLQAYAEPGGIIVSGAVAEQLDGRLEVTMVDLGNLPLKNLKQPVRAFKISTGIAPPLAPLPDVATQPSIAVLPFRKNQIDPSEAYFADGVIEAIVHALAGLKELFVISHSSTLGHGAATVDARTVGREFGVRYALYGSVRRSGGRVRIATELNETETGTVVSTDQYDGDLSDLFALQDQISTRIVTTIAPHVREHELRRALRKHPENLTAYDLVLRALDQLYRMDYDSFSRARGLLQQAIADDPNFAPAHSHAAYWHVTRVGQGWSDDPLGDTAAAAEAAKAAIALDHSDALALAIYGHMQGYLLKDHATARDFLARALAAGPSCAMAWSLSSLQYGWHGDGGAAIERAERSLRLAPFAPNVFWYEHTLSQAHYVSGHYQEAIEWGRRAANRVQTSNLRTLIASLVAAGELDDARRTAQQLLKIEPSFRLSVFAARTPLSEPIRHLFVERLRQSGLPD